MTLRGNVVVDVFDAPPVSVPVDDAPAAPDASAALIPADRDILPSQFPPNNAETVSQTFGRPIGDQSWQYGRHAGVSDYGGCIASPTPIGHADNWGDVDNWRTSTRRRRRTCVEKLCCKWDTRAKIVEPRRRHRPT
jgi:hypothetical protein